MRRVVIQGTPPAKWVAEANAVTTRLRAAANEIERAKILIEKEGLWRADRIRNWLLQQFANKCWYTEAYDSVSPIHVDHYRPKGRVKDLEGNECEGYWWLAFEWNNHRICGHMINSKKGDLFPIVEGVRAIAVDPTSLQLEAPLLIDPVTDQTRLISYEKDEDGCMAVPSADVDNAEEQRAEKTIEVLGLNRLDKLYQKRADYWEKCRMAIVDYCVDGPQALRCFHQKMALKKLREMVAYSAEFSSVSEHAFERMRQVTWSPQSSNTCQPGHGNRAQEEVAWASILDGSSTAPRFQAGASRLALQQASCGNTDP